LKKIKLENQPFGPFPAALAGAMVEDKPNYVMAGAVGCVCLDPVLYVSLKSTHYTTAGVKENGYFSINIPSVDLLPQADFCGLVSGKDTDKSKLFHSFFDEAGNAPMIEECPMNFLCKVFQRVTVRGFDVFYGEIVAAYATESKMCANKPDVEKISPFIMIGAEYCSVDQVVGKAFSAGKSLL
jgi:flavin reductase (DIM6/NTAB) family NADH-FMN oxidoreductase RutF